MYIAFDGSEDHFFDGRIDKQCRPEEDAACILHHLNFIIIKSLFAKKQ